MKNEAVKIAQSQERAKAYEMIRDVLTNPVVTVIAGVILIEFMQSSVNSQGRRVPGGGFMGSNVGTALETTLGAYLLAPTISKAADQIAPLIKAIAPIASTALLAGGG